MILFNYASLAWVLATPAVVSAVPNKMSLKACGLHGNPKRCSIDTSHFSTSKPDGDEIQLDFGQGHRYSCRSKATVHGSNYHASCSSTSNNDGIEGTMNVIKRRNPKNGRDCMHGSLSVNDEICQFSPDATCDEIVVECKAAADFPQPAEPRRPPPIVDAKYAGGDGSMVKTSGLFRKLVTYFRGSSSISSNNPALVFDDSGGNLDIMVVWTKAS